MLKSGALLKLMGALFFASKILAILCILVFLIPYALSNCNWLETLCATPPFGDFNVRPLVQLSRVRVRKETVEAIEAFVANATVQFAKDLSIHKL